jgi:hypothetical protein
MSRATADEPAGPQAAPPAPASTFRERLSPALWVWASVLMLALMTALAAWPFGPIAVVVTGVLAVSTLLVTMLVTAPVVTVTGGELIAGRARIPVSMLGDATALDADGWRYALGPGLDTRAYLCMRGWIPVGVRVDLVDPDDPTPYWLISSRRPAALVAAIEQARASTGRSA